MSDQLTELGCYVLPGPASSPRDLIDQVRTAEDVGIGSVFLSERWNTKEAGVFAGAVGAVSEQAGVAIAATNPNTRHPLLTAALATSMHTLTGGRFALGLGRGQGMLFDAIGLAPVTGAQIEDLVGLLRRLWKGEMILDHDGPAGRFPYLRQESYFDFDIPIMTVSFGPRTLELAGRCMDGVVLHTYLTDQAVHDSLAAVARGAESVGRDPADIRVWSVLATTPDPARGVGRLATYLQGYGDLLVRVNGWDPAVLDRFRADEVVQSFLGAIDDRATPGQREHIAGLLPAEWLAVAATGTPADRAREAARQLGMNAAGARVSGVVLHGATATELAPVVEQYRVIRPDRPAYPVNPGRVA
jgi:5,10-methylenetetrahydromethanopterin reductase